MLEKDSDHLLSFYDFPAEHWRYLRSIQLIEAVFSTVRLDPAEVKRESFSKGVFAERLLPVTFKLVQSAQSQWQRLEGVKYLGNVIEGTLFKDGIYQETDAEDSIEHQKIA